MLRFWILWGLLEWVAITAAGVDAPAAGSNPSTEAAYDNFRNPAGPWSIHVVRVPRGKSPFELHAVHAGGCAVGLSRLSQQATVLNSAKAASIGAINGDFYLREGPYAGDPRGLQIVEGELISAPSGEASVWIDALDEPHTTNTVSQFEVKWPDGATSPFDLNGRREPGELELYTSTVGTSTHTTGGRELVLERPGAGAWLPLRPGKSYRARVREVRESGNTPLSPETMVLSIGPLLARTRPRIQAGSELVISTGTSPNLRGAKTAISGGPVLVREGKAQQIKRPSADSYEFSSMFERHPRSAIGWNNDFFFLVEVDGRQRSLSIGVTLAELASFLVQLGCKEAMNLDGGGSATLWYNGKVQNRPSDGEERPVANSLVVLKKLSGSSETNSTGAAPEHGFPQPLQAGTTPAAVATDQPTRAPATRH